ncbi:hypothetical protein V8E55_002625 [Tylopilus felleus]
MITKIDYIWLRPWTWVSTLFVISNRLLALIGTDFVPGPIKVRTVMFVVGDWGYVLFLAAADLVMILRVYALWNKFRKILGILMFIYVPQIVISIVWEAVPNANFSDAPTLTCISSVTIDRVLKSSRCDYSSDFTTPSAAYRAIPRFILGVALLILAFVPTFKQSVEIYKVTKRWKTTQSMKLLVREGTVYFVVNILFNILNLIQAPIIGLTIFLDGLGYSLSCAIMPRFIISIRERYHSDNQNRWQGVDTGFGVLLQPISSGDAAVSVINFADVISEQEGVDSGIT